MIYFVGNAVVIEFRHNPRRRRRRPWNNGLGTPLRDQIFDSPPRGGNMKGKGEAETAVGNLQDSLLCGESPENSTEETVRANREEMKRNRTGINQQVRG